MASFFTPRWMYLIYTHRYRHLLRENHKGQRLWWVIPDDWLLCYMVKNGAGNLFRVHFCALLCRWRLQIHTLFFLFRSKTGYLLKTTHQEGSNAQPQPMLEKNNINQLSLWNASLRFKKSHKSSGVVGQVHFLFLSIKRSGILSEYCISNVNSMSKTIVTVWWQQNLIMSHNVQIVNGE